MNADIWVGALTTLVGAALGGAISLVLNRQQSIDASKQRAEDEERLKNRRSEDRRFDAYTNFSTLLRSYRDSIRGLEDPSSGQVSVENINECSRTANTASALVFLVAESPETYKSCRAAVRAILNAQTALHNGDRSHETWAEANIEISARQREFQVAARDELGVGGIDRSMVFGPTISAHQRTRQQRAIDSQSES